MKIQITALHELTTTPALNDYIHSKFEKLARHSPHIINTHVTLSVDKIFQQTAKGVVSLTNGGDPLVASATTKDLYASVDELVDKLDEQLLKHKAKH